MDVVLSGYSALIRLVMNEEKSIGLKAQELTSIRYKVAELKRLSVEAFQDHCVNALFTMKLHLLDHLKEDIGTFVSMWMLDASPLGQYNVHVKQVYRLTLQRLSSSMTEMVGVMNSDMKYTG